MYRYYYLTEQGCYAEKIKKVLLKRKKKRKEQDNRIPKENFRSVKEQERDSEKKRIIPVH